MQRTSSPLLHMPLVWAGNYRTKNSSEEIKKNPCASPLTKPPTSPRNRIHCSLTLGPHPGCAYNSPVPSSSIKTVFPYDVLLLNSLGPSFLSTNFSNSTILLFFTTGNVGSVMTPLRTSAARFPCVPSASKTYPGFLE